MFVVAAYVAFTAFLTTALVEAIGVVVAIAVRY